ncbi:hypothetical protein [Haloprofundus salilacus]|uniref:hypothetical protein n=1 Tax=Haloprofundus salilacus TaxID=2876190 RepID=UPI001CCDFA74|nr:hypothetical protein [Haloprofundus salilacus]
MGNGTSNATSGPDGSDSDDGDVAGTTRTTRTTQTAQTTRHSTRVPMSADIVRFVGIGVATGVLVALAAYVTNRAQMVSAVPSWLPFAVGFLGGAYVQVLSRDLGESVRAFLVALVVGTACYLVAALAPLWILPYEPTVRDLLIRSILREEIANLVFASLIPQLFVGYLAAVVVDGTFRS